MILHCNYQYCNEWLWLNAWIFRGYSTMSVLGTANIVISAHWCGVMYYILLYYWT